MVGSKPEFPDDYFTTVEELEERVEGEKFVGEPNGEHWMCDWCAVGVSFKKQPRVSTYLSDRVVNDNTRNAKILEVGESLMPLATYCEDCSKRRVMFPCRGYTEVIVQHSISESGAVVEPSVTDVSPRSDGIPWNPDELTRRITGAHINQLATGPDMDQGPENFITFFLSISDVDIRELVDWKGEVDEKALGRARKDFEKVVSESAERMLSGESESERRKRFRDRVRNE